MTLNASSTQVPTGHGNRAIDDHSPQGIALRTSRRDYDPDRLQAWGCVPHSYVTCNGIRWSYVFATTTMKCDWVVIHIDSELFRPYKTYGQKNRFSKFHLLIVFPTNRLIVVVE
jgi:hypothetical protein